MSAPEEEVEMALFAQAKLYTDLPVFFPNESAEAPTDGSAHVVVTHFRNDSRIMTLAHQDYYQGILQMMICTPRGAGPGEARKRGGDIIALFPKNSVLLSGTTRVRVSKRPVLGSAAPTDVSYELPVRIPYETFI